MKLAFAGFRHGHIYALYRNAEKRKEIVITGCWEEDEEARKQAERELGCTFSYENYEAVLADPKVDAVAIGDYYQKRGSLIIAALKAGKHVICDKPLCTDIRELEQIEELCSRSGRKVCCMLDLRFMAVTEDIRNQIQEGNLGDITIVSFTAQHGLDYEHRPKWYFEENKHGGTINDIAIHGVDLVRYLTGKNLTAVTAAKTWNRYAVQAPNFKDCAQFMAEFDGIALMADVSYAAPEYTDTLPTYWSFDIWGTKGMLRFCLADGNTYCVYKEEKTIYECMPCKTDILTEFMREIEGKESRLNTYDILASARQTLQIQMAAVQTGV